MGLTQAQGVQLVLCEIQLGLRKMRNHVRVREVAWVHCPSSDRREELARLPFEQDMSIRKIRHRNKLVV
jgi:hypothetical protein